MSLEDTTQPDPEERPSFEDVRDSWVGGVPTTVDETSVDPPPVSAPPPLPPRPELPPIWAVRRDVSLLSCRPDALAPGIMMERLAVSDYAGALRVAESILRESPDDADALQASAMCKSELGKIFSARLGRGALVPQLAACAEELAVLPLDARAGLVLSLVDGRRPIDEIVASGRVSPLAALEILSELFLDGVVVLLDPDPKPAT